MARIFLSYKRVDYDKVLLIKQKIESSLGIECWFDLHKVRTSKFFPVELCEAIDMSEIFLFMFSENHLNIVDYENDWTLNELTYAINKKKKVVIVHIDDAKLDGVLSFRFSNFNNVDARNEIQFNRLLNDLRDWLCLPSAFFRGNMVTISYEDGSRYEGEMKNDHFDGYGVFWSKSGEKYEGNWRYGEMSGYGIMDYGNGRRYEGQWLHGDMHGKGKYYSGDGTIVDGYWKDGNPDGPATVYYPDGRKINVLCVNDEMIPLES